MFKCGFLGVDAGNIGVIDNAITEKKGYDHSYDSFTVGPGVYKVKLLIRKCWRGRRTKTQTIMVFGDMIHVGDLCYMFNDGWNKFLTETATLGFDKKKRNDYPHQWFIIDTGGDGYFPYEVEITKIRDLTEGEKE